jgi:hypothetical protein
LGGKRPRGRHALARFQAAIHDGEAQPVVDAAVDKIRGWLVWFAHASVCRNWAAQASAVQCSGQMMVNARLHVSEKKSMLFPRFLHANETQAAHRVFREN